LQNSVVPTPIMALPDQKLVVPRHYWHIGLRRPCRPVLHNVDRLRQFNQFSVAAKTEFLTSYTRAAGHFRFQ